MCERSFFSSSVNDDGDDGTLVWCAQHQHDTTQSTLFKDLHVANIIYIYAHKGEKAAPEICGIHAIYV